MGHNPSDIARLVDEAATELLGLHPTFTTAHPLDKSMIVMNALEREGSKSFLLKVAISADSSFGELRNGWIQSSAGGHVVQDHMLPCVFIHHAIDGEVSDALVAQARDFAFSRTSAETFIAPIGGATIKEPVDLRENVTLIPWKDIPENKYKSKFGKPTPAEYLANSFPRFVVPPTCAIKIEIRNGLRLFSICPIDDTTARLQEITARAEVVADIVRCIAVLAESYIASLGGWTEPTSEFADKIVATGYSWTEALFDVRLTKSCELDGVSLLELFSSFIELKPDDQAVLRVAIDRLNQALGRNNIVDRAIDQGIALETMLLHGIGQGDRGELKYRQAVRGANFLGGTKSERLATFQTLRMAYDLRSKAVHTGQLEADARTTEILQEATTLCAKIARKLITQKSFPNWDTDYVIGSD